RKTKNQSSKLKIEDLFLIIPLNLLMKLYNGIVC
ncbi:unnamed protein product, partial [marine sediment metagenome]